MASSAELRDQWVKALQEAMSVVGRRRDSLRFSMIAWYLTFFVFSVEGTF